MEVFQQTCDKPYDRHTYEIVLKNGKTTSFKYWDEVQLYWYQNCQIPDFLDVIIVKDKKNKKTSGFGA
jgi:hypothetical protein